MSRRLLNFKTRKIHRAWLYSVVYTSKISAFAVILLFFSFTVQPFHQAIAAEDIPVTEESESVTTDSVEEQHEFEIVEEQHEESIVVIDNVESTEHEVVQDEVDSDEIKLTSTASASTSAEVESAEEFETASTSAAVATTTNQQEGSTSTVLTENESIVNEEHGSNGSEMQGNFTATTSSSTQSTEEVVQIVSTTTNSGSGVVMSDDTNTVEQEVSNEVDDVNDSSIEASEDALDNSDTTDSEFDSTPVVVKAEIIVNDDNFYQFSKQSCVAVGDGTYHCSSNEVEDYDKQSVVYSEIGTSGNQEIFLQTSDGDVRQVTDNKFDDVAPHYDAETLQIVWQRLIDGRYQVILYDIVKDKESQLTFSRTNNMEPKVSVDGVVWQAWDNNDWEIMYFDGKFTDQITDNNIQDVTPVIQDKYILWTVIGRGEQEGKVYSLVSKELLTISGYNGGVIENPRFVLVYDTKFENGDVITQGFDPVTGISEPISAKTAPEPIDIPLSDPVGEIRALIQNKSTFEDDHDVEKSPTSDGQVDNNGASTTDDTLNLKDLNKSTSKIAITATSTDEVLELTEFDLILTEPALNTESKNEGEKVPVFDAISTTTSTQ